MAVNNKVSRSGWYVRNMDNGFIAVKKATRNANFLKNLDAIKYIKNKEINERIKLIISAEYNIASLLFRKTNDPIPIIRGYKGNRT